MKKINEFTFKEGDPDYYASMIIIEKITNYYRIIW